MNTLNNYARTERKTPYTGAALDEFSKCMYEFKDHANEGFTFIDFDFLLRNHIKNTFAILEVKTRQGELTYAQTKAFRDVDTCFKLGSKLCGYDYIGFYALTFENTSFKDGTAWLNGKEITNKQFFNWLKHHF